MDAITLKRCRWHREVYYQIECPICALPLPQSAESKRNLDRLRLIRDRSQGGAK